MPVATRKKAQSSAAVSPVDGAKAGGLRNDLKRYTRDKILNAALASFQEIGFKETTVERIVELAGTTAPTFYRHFAAKDDLLPPLQDYLAHTVKECLDKLTTDDIKNSVSLTRWIGEYMQMWNEVHHLCKAFWDATDLKEKMAPSTFMLMFDTGDTIDRLLPTTKKPDRDDRKMRMGMIMLMLDRLAHLVSICPDKDTADQLVLSFSEMMWRSVFARQR